MSEQAAGHEPAKPIDLRDPVVAAVMAWLVPGLGHLYQRRFAKSGLYFVCVMTLFVYGLALGSVPEKGWYGRVVYFSWRQEDKRLFYVCQVGAGLVALPALVQAHRMANHRRVWFSGFQAPPRIPAVAAPRDDPNRDQPTPHDLHSRLHRYFELGTVYTAVAGLLNILAIYDAWGGPVLSAPKKEEEEDAGEPDGENGTENPERPTHSATR